MKKLDYVDALRGLAILAVVVIHTSLYGTFAVSPTIGKVIGEGARGVQLFYVASAFTLFLSFQNRSHLELSPIRNFFIRRVFRIAPMYWLGIAYYLYQDGFGPRYWLGDAPGISALNIASNATFLHGLNPYWINSLVPGGWSIAVEMMFYAFVPLLFFKITNLNRAFAFFLLGLLLKAGLHLLFVKYPLISDYNLWAQYLYFYFPAQLPVFALGIMMYYIITDDPKTSSGISGIWMLLFAGMLLFQFATKIELLFHNHIFFGIAFLILGVALSRYRFPLIVNPVVTYIGKISFSMYLVHFAVLHWMEHLHFTEFSTHGVLNYVMRYVVVVIIAALISTVTYKLIEVPCQNLGKKLIKRLEGGNNATTQAV